MMVGNALNPIGNVTDTASVANGSGVDGGMNREVVSKVVNVKSILGCKGAKKHTAPTLDGDLMPCMSLAWIGIDRRGCLIHDDDDCSGSFVGAYGLGSSD